MKRAINLLVRVELSDRPGELGDVQALYDLQMAECMKDPKRAATLHELAAAFSGFRRMLSLAWADVRAALPDEEERRRFDELSAAVTATGGDTGDLKAELREYRSGCSCPDAKLLSQAPGPHHREDCDKYRPF